MANEQNGQQIEIDAEFRVQDGVVQFRCPRTYRFYGKTEWTESHTSWTSVDELAATLARELEEGEAV